MAASHPYSDAKTVNVDPTYSDAKTVNVDRMIADEVKSALYKVINENPVKCCKGIKVCPVVLNKEGQICAEFIVHEETAAEGPYKVMKPVTVYFPIPPTLGATVGEFVLLIESIHDGEGLSKKNLNNYLISCEAKSLEAEAKRLGAESKEGTLKKRLEVDGRVQGTYYVFLQVYDLFRLPFIREKIENNIVVWDYVKSLLPDNIKQKNFTWIQGFESVTFTLPNKPNSFVDALDALNIPFAQLPNAAASDSKDTSKIMIRRADLEAKLAQDKKKCALVVFNLYLERAKQLKILDPENLTFLNNFREKIWFFSNPDYLYDHKSERGDQTNHTNNGKGLPLILYKPFLPNAAEFDKYMLEPIFSNMLNQHLSKELKICTQLLRGDHFNGFRVPNLKVLAEIMFADSPLRRTEQIKSDLRHFFPTHVLPNIILQYEGSTINSAVLAALENLITPEGILKITGEQFLSLLQLSLDQEHKLKL